MHSNNYVSTKTPTLCTKKVFEILIVDDDIDASEMFKDILELRGHHVCLINEGIQCINKCKDKQFDIIFMDYHMEGMDGVELTDLLKDLFKTDCEIFAFTGDITDDAIEQFKTIGMNGALIKPIDPKLIDNLMNSLEERQCVDKNIFMKLARKNKTSLIYFN